MGFLCFTSMVLRCEVDGNWWGEGCAVHCFLLAPHRICAASGPCSGRSDATRPPASFPLYTSYLKSPNPITTTPHTRPTSGQPGTPVTPAVCAHFVRRSSKKLSGTPRAHTPLQQSWQDGSSCNGRAVRAHSMYRPPHSPRISLGIITICVPVQLDCAIA